MSLRLTLAAAALAIAVPATADTYVRGYTRQDGTYVQPHYRTDRDNDRSNNYSSQGNVNPYTGQTGSTRNDDTYIGSRAGSTYGSGSNSLDLSRRR